MTKGGGGRLHLDDEVNMHKTVKDILIDKHPPAQPIHPSCIVSEAPQDPHTVIFDSIDGSVIRKAALQVKGAAGPSSLDAHEWRRLCTCHKNSSRDLCTAIAFVARRLCSSHVDPVSIVPLLSCRLIALDKNPGVHPIGIGDTLRRIIAEAILFVTASNIQDAMGCLQLCAGQISGIEAAVHSTRSAFESDDVEAVLLVDASNAFIDRLHYSTYNAFVPPLPPS